MATIYLTGEEELFDAEPGDTVYASNKGSAIFGGKDNIFYGGTGHDNFGIGANSKGYGGAGDDQLELYDDLSGGEIYGDAGNDLLYVFYHENAKAFGGTGDDRILSFGREKKYIDGGAGTDSLYLDIIAGDDPLIGSFNAATKESLVYTTTIKNIENIKYDLSSYTTISVTFGASNDDVYIHDAYRVYLNGGGGNDTLRGAGGGSRLIGGDGNDILLGRSPSFIFDVQYEGSWFEGGKGSDTMTGGIDGDFFVFQSMGKKDRDTITRFDSRDTLLSTVALKDSNKDGTIEFGSDGLLSIGSGKVKLTGADGTVVTSLVYAGETEMFGQHYYSYTLANHEGVNAEPYWAS